MHDKKMTIKAVLFDLDDTLWPIGPTIQRAEAAQHAWLEAHAPRLAQSHSRESLRARRMELAASVPRFRFDLWSLRHTALCEALAASGEDPAKAEEAMAVFSRERNIVSLFDDVAPGLVNLEHDALDRAADVIANVGRPPDVDLAGRQKDVDADIDQQPAFDLAGGNAGNDVAFMDGIHD